MTDKLTPEDARAKWIMKALIALIPPREMYSEIKTGLSAEIARIEDADRRVAEAPKHSETTDMLLGVIKNTCGPEVYDKALKSLAEDYEREGLGNAAAGCYAAKDGECSWADCPQNRDGEPAKTGRHCPRLNSAPFRLEVGKSYARRDGTGPVKIVADDRDVWPLHGDDGHHYTRDGFFRTRYYIDPRDLVALWQAEAQAPEPNIADKCHALAAKAVAERNGWQTIVDLETGCSLRVPPATQVQAPQTDADEPRLTPEPGAVIWIDGFRYVHQPEAAAPSGADTSLEYAQIFEEGRLRGRAEVIGETTMADVAARFYGNAPHVAALDRDAVIEACAKVTEKLGTHPAYWAAAAAIRAMKSTPEPKPGD
jgi:hypothetical protein